MFRLSQTTKCIGVVMVSALLLWATSGVPGVSQQQAGPLLTRSQIVNGLNQAFATLTAAGGVFWNFDASVLLSTPNFTGAFVPLSKEDFERSEEVLADMLLILVEVSVNNQGPFSFIIDTGATVPVLSPETAHTLGLDKGTPDTAYVVGSQMQASLVSLASLRVGEAEVKDLSAGGF